MKNLLTNISQEEKNRILEMHSGMKKTIKEQYDDQNGVEETTRSILEKHHLLDETKMVKENMVVFQGKSPEVIQRFLSILHLLTDVVFMSIVDCEFADFSNVDICGLPMLSFINLIGTENNFDEQGFECSDKQEEGFYYVND